MIGRIIIALFLCTLVASSTHGEEAGQVQEQLQKLDWLKLGASPYEACIIAVKDQTKLTPIDAPFQRYFWFPHDGTRARDNAVFNKIMNEVVSRSGLPVYPMSIMDGLLLRYDVRLLAPDEKDFLEIDRLIAELSPFDPYFHSTIAVEQNFKVDGRKQIVGEENRVTTASPLTGEAGLALLGGSGTVGTIYRADWFVAKVSSTLKDGKYYQFAGIETKPSDGTAFEAFLRKIGIDPKLLFNSSGRNSSGMFRSGVTGKPRRIDLFRNTVVPPTAGTGLTAITFDQNDDQQEAARDPIRNLSKFAFAGQEVIAEKPNGLHWFALFDNEGNLVASVPDNIATDALIPNPHTKRLHSMISCVRCHGIGKDDGWKPFTNEVQILLSGDGPDVLDDLSSAKSIPATLLDLAQRYRGRPETPLILARNTYSDMVFRLTKGMSVAQAAEGIGEVYKRYYYDMVNPQVAAAELGYLVTEDEPVEGAPPHRLYPRSVEILKILLPPLPPADDGISPEDPMIAALKRGLAINRNQWEEVFTDAALRAMQTIQLKAVASMGTKTPDESEKKDGTSK